jgi:hypothetical protein
MSMCIHAIHIRLKDAGLRQKNQTFRPPPDVGIVAYTLQEP